MLNAQEMDLRPLLGWRCVKNVQPPRSLNKAGASVQQEG